MRFSDSQLLYNRQLFVRGDTWYLQKHTPHTSVPGEEKEEREEGCNADPIIILGEPRPVQAVCL